MDLLETRQGHPGVAKSLIFFKGVQESRDRGVSSTVTPPNHLAESCYLKGTLYPPLYLAKPGPEMVETVTTYLHWQVAVIWEANQFIPGGGS